MRTERSYTWMEMTRWVLWSLIARKPHPDHVRAAIVERLLVTTEVTMHAPEDFNFHKWFIDETLPILISGSNKVIAMGEQHLPILLLFGYKKGDVVPVVIPDFGDKPSKEVVAHMQKDLCKHVDRVAAVIFLSEVWTASFDRKEDSPSNLENYPGKGEGMMFNAMHGDQQLMAICDIDRTQKRLGEPRILDPNKDHLEGRMVNR